MRVFQDTFRKLKRLFISVFSIYMTVPLKFKDVFQGFCCVKNFLQFITCFLHGTISSTTFQGLHIHTLDIANKNDGFQ